MINCSLRAVWRLSDGIGDGMMRGWFLLASSLFLISGVSFAQPLPLDPEVAAYYAEIPNEGEQLVQTREGCGWILEPSSLGDPLTPIGMHGTAKYYRYHSWDGACYNGLALGPGKWRRYDIGGEELLSIHEVWALNGRRIGMTMIMKLPYAGYDADLAQMVEWKGTSYYRNVRDAAPLEPRRDREPEPRVRFVPPDVQKVIEYTLSAQNSEKPARVVQSSMTAKYKQTGNFFDRDTDHPCPKKKGCGALWVEKAGPIIRAFDEFERRHAAEIAAVKASLDPVVQSLLDRREQDLRAARKPAPEPGISAKLRSGARGQSGGQ